MAKYLLTIWTTSSLAFFVCILLSASVDSTDMGKSGKRLYTAVAEEPVQHLEKESKPKSSMEWIKDYLFKYIDSRFGTTTTTNPSATDLSVSSTNSVGEGRQMPTQSSLGDAIAVGGLALLFINQLSVALNLPFLLPFMLIPVALLTIAVKLLSNADNNGNSNMVTQMLRSQQDEYAGWNFEQPWQTGWVVTQ